MVIERMTRRRIAADRNAISKTLIRALDWKKLLSPTTVRVIFAPIDGRTQGAESCETRQADCYSYQVGSAGLSGLQELGDLGLTVPESLPRAPVEYCCLVVGQASELSSDVREVWPNEDVYGQMSAPSRSDETMQTGLSDTPRNLSLKTLRNHDLGNGSDLVLDEENALVYLREVP